MVTHEGTLKLEGGKRYLVMDCRGCQYGCDIAAYPQCMQEVIDYLGKTNADLVVLAEAYERVYDEEQTELLKEIANLVQRFKVRGVWSPSAVGDESKECERLLPQRHDLMVNIASDLIRTDPVKAYLLTLETLKKETERLPTMPAAYRQCTEPYLKTLNFVKASFENTRLIQKLRSHIQESKELPEGRGIYHSLFEVQLKPSFIGSRLLFSIPAQVELIDQYNVHGTQVSIYRHPEKIEYLYHIDPPEYNLPPEKYFLLKKTKDLVSTYHPEGLEFTDLASSEDYFIKLYETSISDIAKTNRIEISEPEKSQLAEIVARYTIGYGILGLILSDERLTDVYLDSPLGSKPVYVVHGEYGPCQTNVVFSDQEAKSVISRFRSISGRPFDEAHSVLDLDLMKYHTRVAVIGPPLSPDGVAFALRIHKDTPWTLPQFIDVKMINAQLAGLMSFLVDAQASTLVVGSRGSGKTSMLTALMLEILPSLRMLTIEDTLEIPVDYFRKNGFNVQRLKTRSAIEVSAISSEVSPEDALRTALRLGDSCIIVGEVRSKEALVLYEAMRVGAVGNIVMGTIHAESAYSVWDRVVNDLGVPNTSFKATDICVVQAPIRFKGSLKKHRRVIEVTEVGKLWYDDPGKEGGLLNLMEYDARTDHQAVMKDDILKKSEMFKKVSKRRGLSMETIWDDIMGRAESKQFLVDMKNQYSIPDLLEGHYTVRANDKYMLIQEKQREELGAVNYRASLDEWKGWIKEGFVKELIARRKARESAERAG